MTTTTPAPQGATVAARPIPPQLLLGVATAAYQIEGATHRDGRADSIWDAFSRIPGAVVGGESGERACEHYDRYRDDVALMRELGVQVYRFSTSWARVQPDGRTANPAGLDFYRRLTDELLEAGITPWLTLYHWDLPQALQESGGWPARDTELRFAHDAADVDAARRIDAQHNRLFLDPIFRGAYPADLVADLEARGLHLPVDEGDLAAIATPIDALGVNYYHGDAVSAHPPAAGPLSSAAPSERPKLSPFPAGDGIFTHPRGLPVTAMGWEVQPDGLTRLLVRIDEEYARPAGVTLYVTENGAAYTDAPDAEGVVDDAERAEFVRLHVDAVVDAIEAGVNVRGYFYWSLLDNFEWAWGYDKRFGLVRVDYDTQRRTVKRSGRLYQSMIAGRSVPPALEPRP